MSDAEAPADSFRRLAWGLTSASTVDGVCKAIAEHGAPVLRATHSNVGIRSPVSGVVNVHYAASLEADLGPEWTERRLDEPTMLTDAIRTGAAIVIDTLDELAERYPSMVALARELGVSRLVAYPVDASETGGSRGAIGFGWPSGAVLPPDHEVTSVVSLCAAALTRAWATDENRRLAAITQALTREAPLGFALLDTQLRYIDVNHHLAEINGVAADAHLGRAIREVVPGLADRAESVFRSVLASGVPEKIEISGTTRADPGVEHVWDEIIVPVKDSSGQIIALAAIVEDITERRRSREELRQLYAREHDVATRLQQGLLPRFLPQPEGYELAVRYVPGSAGLRIGGDWYESLALRDDCHALIVGDVVGHGIEAALTMIQVRYSLTALSHAVSRPDWLLNRLDELVAAEGERYVATLFYGVLEPSEGLLTYSAAGHPPPLAISPDGAVARIDEGRGPPLGITGSSRPVSAIAVDPGATILLCTDGLFERRGEDIEAGLQRLEAACARRIDNLQAFADDLIHSVPDIDHEDDIALMLVRRDPAVPDEPPPETGTDGVRLQHRDGAGT